MPMTFNNDRIVMSAGDPVFGDHHLLS